MTASMDKVEAMTAAPAVTWREWSEEWIRTIVFALLWYYCIITFVVEAYKIPTGSMWPTLHGEDTWKGDRVLAIKALNQFRPLRRGDVIVFNSVEPQPGGQQKRLVKRLVAFAGEEIQILKGRLVIDDAVVDDPPIFKAIRYTAAGNLDRGEKFRVPPNCYFAMGDNTDHSLDSRYWGALPAENLLGRALFVWWPFDHIKSLSSSKTKLE